LGVQQAGKEERQVARFTGKTVLITGGAKGQGAEDARRWVAEGGRVLIADVADDTGDALAADLGPLASYVHLDVSQDSDWASAMAAAAACGGLHGLVNNAGIYHPQSMQDTSLESFQRHVQVNQIGCFLGMKHAAELMANTGGGSIVNISSTAGLRGSPGSFAYCATKWAIRGMTRAAAGSLASLGIRVNSVYPGPIDTDMIKFRTPEQTKQRLSKVPMGRMGSCAEVAHIVIFLLSDESSYMTGAEIAVDGGVSM